jgi:hypothetical protein
MGAAQSFFEAVGEFISMLACIIKNIGTVLTTGLVWLLFSAFDFVFNGAAGNTADRRPLFPQVIAYLAFAVETFAVTAFRILSKTFFYVLPAAFMNLIDAAMIQTNLGPVVTKWTSMLFKCTGDPRLHLQHLSHAGNTFGRFGIFCGCPCRRPYYAWGFMCLKPAAGPLVCSANAMIVAAEGVDPSGALSGSPPAMASAAEHPGCGSRKTPLEYQLADAVAASPDDAIGVASPTLRSFAGQHLISRRGHGSSFIGPPDHSPGSRWGLSALLRPAAAMAMALAFTVAFPPADAPAGGADPPFRYDSLSWLRVAAVNATLLTVAGAWVALSAAGGGQELEGQAEVKGFRASVYSRGGAIALHATLAFVSMHLLVSEPAALLIGPGGLMPGPYLSGVVGALAAMLFAAVKIGDSLPEQVAQRSTIAGAVTWGLSALAELALHLRSLPAQAA